jgi:O-antigen/teichoic acid export membrane protein
MSDSRTYFFRPTGPFGLLKLTSGLLATLQTMATNTLIIVINLGTGILTARFLGPGGRGEQTAMIVWLQLFAFLFSMGMPQTIIYKVKHDPEHASEYVVTALMVSAAAGTIAGALGIILIPRWLNNYTADTIRFAQWMMLATPLCSIYYAAAAAVQAAGRFRLYNVMMLVLPLSTLAGLVGLAMAGEFWPKSSALAYVLPIVPAIVLAFILLGRTYKLAGHLRRSVAKSLMGHGVRVWGVDLLVTLSRQADKAILVGLLLPSELGAYVVAQSVVSCLSVVHNSVYAVLYPKAAGRSAREIMATSSLAIRVCAVVVCVGAVILGICAPFLLKLLYGAEFSSAISPFRILAADAVLAAINMLCVQVFMAAGRPGVVALLQAAGLAAYLPLALVLVPALGLDGAALAWLASTALRLISIFCCFPLVLGIRPPWPIMGWMDVVQIRAKLSAGR